MMRPVGTPTALAAIAATILLPSAEAQAGAFAVREQSAYFQGMSFAGIGAPGPSISAMFWNPATVTTANGLVIESNATLIVPTTEVSPNGTTRAIVAGAGGVPRGAGDIGPEAIVPASYVGWQATDRLFLGLSLNAPFGLTTKTERNWAGQIYARTSDVMTLNATPVIGFKVTDWLSVGAGVQVQYIDVRLTRAQAVFRGAPSAELSGDDVAFGFVAGLTITPMAGTEIGIGYRSGIDHNLKGDLTVTLPVLGRVTGDIKGDVPLPDQVTVGIRQRVTDAFTLSASVEWSHWNRLGNVVIRSDLPGPLATTVLPFNYDDGWFAAIGGEYRWSPELTLRAGLGYEWSPIDTDIRSLRLPDNDRLWTSIGLSYAWSHRLSIDLGYTHLWVPDTDLRIVPGHQDYAGLPFVGKADSHVDILAIGVRYKLGPDAPAPVPVVVKY